MPTTTFRKELRPERERKCWLVSELLKIVQEDRNYEHFNALATAGAESALFSGLIRIKAF